MEVISNSKESTELTLRTTPTGGIPGEHSPYFRRLLSAGYKGYIQGVIGGAGYYGTLGLAVGALVAIPAAIMTGGTAALLFIPMAAGVGIVKGVNTFGNIGQNAAINAESADMAEQRRYLLDRFYQLPEGPEGDKQAAIIKDELAQMTKSEKPKQLFHWKTAAICAGIGVALTLGAWFLPAIAPVFAGVGVIGEVVGPIAAHLAAIQGVISAPVFLAMGTALGGLVGATIGLDRHIIRSWFDATEKLVSDPSHQQEALQERSAQVSRLQTAALADEKTRLILDRRHELPPYQSRDAALVPPEALPRPAAPKPTEVAALGTAIAPVVEMDVPDSKIHAAQLQSRLADIQQAMSSPAV